MNLGILEIDHLLTYVADIAAASSAYERMGFRLTPESHITSMGIVNRLALLTARTDGAANFVELMGVADASRLPPAMQRVLSGRQGIKSMVMCAPDAAAAQQMLVAAGYGFAPPQHVKREWVLPGEGSVWPEFDVLLPIPAPLDFNVCQYHNLPLYQRADWREHPNGALSMEACLAVADDPQACAEYFATLFARPARAGADGALCTTPAATTPAVYTPAAFEARHGVAAGKSPGSPGSPGSRRSPAYAGMRIGVRDLDRLRACLADGGVPARDHGDRVVVGPEHACGNVIEFAPA